MIKLNSIVERLESVKEKIEEKIEDIYIKADEKGRDLTEREEERVDELSAELDDIDGAIDYLREYCD